MVEMSKSSNAFFMNLNKIHENRILRKLLIVKQLKYYHSYASFLFFLTILHIILFYFFFYHAEYIFVVENTEKEK